MIPDYDSFEDFDTGFELSSETAELESDEDFLTVDRDVAESFETGIIGNDDESDDD